MIRRIVVCVGRGTKASFWGAMEAMGFVGWLFQNAESVEIAHKNMGKQAEVMLVYSAQEVAIFKGRRPTRKEMKASWSHAMLLEEVMVEIKTASTAERAAILVGLKMLDEVRGLHVQTEWTEGHECGCKEYVVKMIEALSADGRVVAEFAAQREQSRVWREMQARREEPGPNTNTGVLMYLRRVQRFYFVLVLASNNRFCTYHNWYNLPFFGCRF
jgi:hypothetical protein